MTSDSSLSLTIGAVAYDAKVVTIWDGFRAWFAERNFALDYVLYSHYERQVIGQFRGEHHVSWNSPLAWLQAQALANKRGLTCHAVAMRDTDRDLASVLVANAAGSIKSLADLKGKRVGFGAADSPQATLIPLEAMAEAGLREGVDFEAVRFDVLLGKHGDHIGGERDAAKALSSGHIDAAWVLDANYQGFCREGTLTASQAAIIASTAPYDHCNFTVLNDGRTSPEAVQRLVGLLLSMRYDDPSARPLLDLEGLKEWKLGRIQGYAVLQAACDRFGVLNSFLDQAEAAR